MKTVPVAEVSEALLAEARSKNCLQEVEQDGLVYTRASNDVKSLVRGTIIVGGRVIPSFPHIGRILALEAGMKKNLHTPFRLEEKIDGYNVRIARFEGRILPFTRGGFVCPFTADRLPDLVDLDPLFDAHPNVIVCAEISGRGNPYSASPSDRVVDDIELHAFDLMGFDRSEFFEMEACDAIFQRFGVPQAPVLGRFDPDQVEEVKRHVLELDRLGAEGVVFKPDGEGERVKYVTPTTNLCDITRDVHLLAELPGSTFVLRLLRLVLAVEELGLEERLPEMEVQLGRSLLEDFLHTVEAVRRGEGVMERRSLHFRHAESADRWMRHLNRVARSVKVRELSRHDEGDHTTLEIEKRFQASSDRIRDLLNGTYVID